MTAQPALLSAGSDAGAVDDARRAARLRVYELLRASQLQGELSTPIVVELIDDAEARGWPDVVKLGMFLGIFCERHVERGTGERWIAALLERAENDGDPVMTALALAARAQDLSVGGGRSAVDADRDLARATVLLEGAGPSSEAVSAHIECAYACECRDLWELQLRHYEAAEACLDWGENASDRHQVLLYNRAETEVTWVAALRERGPCPELAERAQHARGALEAADIESMPASWREDLRVFRDLVDAISPPAGADLPRPRPAAGEYAGFVHLTHALRAGDPATALAHCERGIEVIDPVATNRIHLVSLALAVELQSVLAGHETAALCWGRKLVAHRWDRRLAALASVQSLVEIERREAEHTLLAQHAYLDDLTGLANRRALTRFVGVQCGRGVAAAAVALIDLDHFKSINDRHGHAVGDEVLVRMAAILRAAVREQDLVVRLGGDEFLLVLLVPDAGVARRRGESIVAKVNASCWTEVCEQTQATVSVGVAFGPLADFDELTAAADAALYRAKQAGGDRSAAED